MKILITYAVDPEFEPWKKAHRFELVVAGDSVAQRTYIGSAIVDFVVTGMGGVRATRAVQTIELHDYDLCIASGFAGAVVPKLDVGDILAPKRVRQGKSNDLVACDTALIEQAQAVGAKTSAEIVSWDRVATTAEEKNSLISYGEAVDMESYAVLRETKNHGLRSVVIRVISDRHDQVLPVDLSKAVDERGQISIGSVVKLAAGNPLQLGALMKLGRESRAAADALARFLERFITQIAAQERQSGLQSVSGQP